MAVAGSHLQNEMFLNLIVLGGNTEEKLRAAKNAGFDAVEIWNEDVDSYFGGATAVRTLSVHEKLV